MTEFPNFGKPITAIIKIKNPIHRGPELMKDLDAQLMQIRKEIVAEFKKREAI
mgnify:CR=1 FL=1